VWFKDSCSICNQTQFQSLRILLLEYCSSFWTNLFKICSQWHHNVWLIFTILTPNLQSWNMWYQLIFFDLYNQTRKKLINYNSTLNEKYLSSSIIIKVIKSRHKVTLILFRFVTRGGFDYLKSSHTEIYSRQYFDALHSVIDDDQIASRQNLLL
jgi:hypothetical protein